MSIEEQRRRNRERMPAVADLMDQIREVFGDVRLIHAIDHVTGVEVGDARYADGFVDAVIVDREKEDERKSRTKAR